MKAFKAGLLGIVFLGSICAQAQQNDEIKYFNVLEKKCGPTALAVQPAERVLSNSRIIGLLKTSDNAEGQSCTSADLYMPLVTASAKINEKIILQMEMMPAGKKTVCRDKASNAELSEKVEELKGQMQGSLEMNEKSNRGVLKIRGSAECANNVLELVLSK